MNGPDTATTCTHPRGCVLDSGHPGDHIDRYGTARHNYGPVQHYEIVWMSGHVETVPAHQITYPHAGLILFTSGSVMGSADNGPPRVHIHAEIDGQWLLTLAAREEDIRSMRLVTSGEEMPR